MPEPLDMREKWYAYEVIIIQPCSQRKPNQVKSNQELICVYWVSVSGRVLELYCLTEFTLRKRLRLRQDSNSPRRVWRRLQSGTDQSLQSPLLTNTKESISARVGLGRKRYLGNITKGQSLTTPHPPKMLQWQTEKETEKAYHLKN